jgi:WD40 repeat protein
LDEATRWIAFSPDGDALVTGSADGRVRLWSPETGRAMDTLQAAGSNLTALGFAGDRLVIANAETCAVWTLGRSWSLVRTIGSGDTNSPLTDRVNAVAFSPDGRLLATGSGEPSRSGQVKLWDVATGQLVREFKDLHSDAVLALEFSPDGRQLASGAADRLAKITDVATGQVLHTLEGHTAHVLGLSWKFDGRTLATCGADRQVRLWDAVSGDKGKAVPPLGKDVEAVHFLGTTDQLAAAAGDGQLRIFNEAGAVVRSLGVAKEFLQAAATTPDGRLLATGDEDGHLLIWRDPAAPPAMTFAVPDRHAAK